jgi:hypothetical protein
MKAGRKHTEDIHDLQSSLITITVLKPKDMRWAWHVTHMRERCKRIQNFEWKTERAGTAWKTKA